MRTSALVSVLAFLVIGLGCQSDNSPTGDPTTAVMPERGAAVGAVPAADAPPSPQPVYEVGELAVKPVCISRAQPKYPFELRRRGITGRAIIEFVVTSDGRVAGAVVREATDPAFGVAALDSVRQWKFNPAEIDGQPVNCRMLVPIVFALNGRY